MFLIPHDLERTRKLSKDRWLKVVHLHFFTPLFNTSRRKIIYMWSLSSSPPKNIREENQLNFFTHIHTLNSSSSSLSTMKAATKAFPPGPTALCFSKASKLVPYTRSSWSSRLFHPLTVKLPGSLSTSSCMCSRLSSARTSSQGIAPPDVRSDVFQHTGRGKPLEAVEENIEKVIYRCRFLAILAVFGSLFGSLLCFVKGCTYIGASFQAYFANRGKVIMLLVEAIDIYLLGTVMLVFGMGLYELFISNLDKVKHETSPYRSNFFGLFALKERPRWLEISTVNELKTKLGHVIVMLLLIGLFEKSKVAMIVSPIDLLCFSASVLLCSGCLFLLSKLKE